MEHYICTSSFTIKEVWLSFTLPLSASFSPRRLITLHLIFQAMKLYEQLSFLRVKEIQGMVCLVAINFEVMSLFHLISLPPPFPAPATQDYYTINNVNYNCFLYARYFHGNRGHRNSIYAILIDFAASFLNIF